MDRDSGDLPAEVRFTECRGRVTGGVGEQVVEFKFAGCGQEQQGPGVVIPGCGHSGVADSEDESSVGGLDSLDCGRQVSPGYQVEARPLSVRHESILWHGPGWRCLLGHGTA